MCGYEPKFSISTKSINLVSEISALVKEIELAHVYMDLRLRRKNRIISIQSSLQIEANSMTIDQVSDMIEGKRVLGPAKDILEVKNAIDAYNLIPKLNPSSSEDLLRLHGVMMAGLTDQAGMFRTVGVNVVNSKTREVIHYAPHPDFVPVFIEDLMQWVRTTDHHPLIVSCVFHHEFEYIHPFTDGNGRTGRLWQTLLLSKWNPVFEWLPVESAIRDRQTEYYEAIRNATDEGDTCVFIEFILEAIRDSLIEALGSADSGMETKVFHIIKEGRYTNATDVARMLGVSERTVRRAITSLKEKNAIKRDGSTKTGRWVVAETHVSE